MPDVLDGVQLRGSRRQQDHRDVLRDAEGAGRVPAGPVEKQDGMSASFDRAGDLIEVKLHSLSVGEGQRQGGACTAGRADRTEQIRALIALVGGLARPRSASRPLPHEAVLLADPGLVLEPDLDGLSRREGAEVGPQRGREVLWDGPPLLLRLALAGKLARIAWAVLRSGESYAAKATSRPAMA